MPLTFCIIDDEEEVCDVLRLYFESRGHRCHVAHDGEKGIALIRQHRPAAVFLDVQMPRMNGYEVLNRLRADDATRAIPIMLMTALTKESNMGDVDWAKSAGADLFLPKPFELDDLLVAVEKLTGVRIT
ncbi:response regulator [Candidatus Sumerlaeota bacterium]|nr:response regulator [Candidatus Sumerlaeota bacterium]